MKKIILTLFISLIIFSPNVFADEVNISSCSSSINILPQPGLKAGRCTLTDNKFTCEDNNYFTHSDYIPVFETGKYTFTYYSKSGFGSLSGAKIALLDKDFNFISDVGLNTSSYVTNLSTSFDITEDTKYLFLYTNSSNNVNSTFITKYNELQSNPKLQLEYSSSFTSWTKYAEDSCPIIEPEVPEEPETPIQDSTLDDFYNLLNSKLKLIASSTLENKFMFSVIGIVVLFTVLGLFFKIFRIGGK